MVQKFRAIRGRGTTKNYLRGAQINSRLQRFDSQLDTVGPTCHKTSRDVDRRSTTGLSRSKGGTAEKGGATVIASLIQVTTKASSRILVLHKAKGGTAEKGGARARVIGDGEGEVPADARGLRPLLHHPHRRGPHPRPPQPGPPLLLLTVPRFLRLHMPPNPCSILPSSPQIIHMHAFVKFHHEKKVRAPPVPIHHTTLSSLAFLISDAPHVFSASGGGSAGDGGPAQAGGPHAPAPLHRDPQCHRAAARRGPLRGRRDLRGGGNARHREPRLARVPRRLRPLRPRRPQGHPRRRLRRGVVPHAARLPRPRPALHRGAHLAAEPAQRLVAPSARAAVAGQEEAVGAGHGEGGSEEEEAPHDGAAHAPVRGYGIAGHHRRGVAPVTRHLRHGLSLSCIGSKLLPLALLLGCEWIWLT